jgi:hypothetical protein
MYWSNSRYNVKLSRYFTVWSGMANFSVLALQTAAGETNTLVGEEDVVVLRPPKQMIPSQSSDRKNNLLGEEKIIPRQKSDLGESLTATAACATYQKLFLFGDIWANVIMKMHFSCLSRLRLDYIHRAREREGRGNCRLYVVTKVQCLLRTFACGFLLLHPAIRGGSR